MITRTIKTSTINVMTANTTLGTIENVSIEISKDFNGNTKEIEKVIRKNGLLDAEHVFVKINGITITEERYGMTEEDFMKYAVKLEK